VQRLCVVANVIYLVRDVTLFSFIIHRILDVCVRVRIMEEAKAATDRAHLGGDD
jgi:hypothetical protein